MIDITSYSDNELSLIVFNDEWFYRRRLIPSLIINQLNEEYIYTDEQLKVLLDDLELDAEEE